jgi:hypothetical protein
MGDLAMKATFTICKATFRSLNAITFLFVFYVLTMLAAPTSAAERDLMRSDILTFVGQKNPQSVVETSDSYLVQLNCRSSLSKSAPAKYSVVLRGIDSIERALLQDAQDGKWDHFDLFRAALIVEGLREPNKIRAYEARLDGIVSRVKAKLQAEGTPATPEILTKELFEALHREILTSPYDIDCTELGKVMETGHFNCVSATVLFNCLAYKAGLDVYALEMPGHALSRVKFNGQSMNLETTCPTWFSLQSNAARQNATMSRVAPQTASVNPVTGNSVANTETAVELSDMSKNLREISPVQLIATIYYNLGVDLHAQKRYAEAAAANIKALHLDPANTTAWGNLVAAINNWAIELSSPKDGTQKRYDIAAALLDQGVVLDATYGNFRANQLHVFYSWIYELATQNRIADAKTVFTYADERLPNDPNLANLMQEIAKRTK